MVFNVMLNLLSRYREKNKVIAISILILTIAYMLCQRLIYIDFIQ